MYIKRSQNALTVSKGVNMAIPFRPLGTWDIKVELGTAGVLGVRDGDVLSMMNLSQYDAIGIVDLEDKASTYELTLVLMDGRQVRPTALGAIPGSDVVLSMSWTQLQITGNDLVEVVDWGKLPNYAPTITGYQFYQCTNLTTVPTSIPGWVTDMARMFYQCSVFNSDLSQWDTSSVTNMSSMFRQCTTFNSDISQWDVSSVTDMSYMFNSCTNFNSNISRWDVTKVTDMMGMFYKCSNFNQDLSSWRVSNFIEAPYSFDIITTAWTLPKPEWATGPIRQIVLHTDGEKSNFNVYSYFGNPTEVTDYVLVVDHEIYSTGSTVPALQTGTFPAGSKLTIVNNSYIRGAGGDGGNNQGGNPSSGKAGGTAIFTQLPLTLDNTNGYIWAGGGGGGAVNKFQAMGAGGTGRAFEAGGGGGAGSIPGKGGVGRWYGTGQYGGTGGTANGSPGTLTTGGASGHVGVYAGSLGVAGAGGDSAGGRGGYSVQLNGNALTWIGGNDATRVKGVIV